MKKNIFSDAKNLTFDTDKARPRRRKAQMVAKEMDVERKSTLSIRYVARNFPAISINFISLSKS